MKATWTKQHSSAYFSEPHYNGPASLIQNGYIRLGYRGAVLALVAVGGLFLLALIAGYRFAHLHLGAQTVTTAEHHAEDDLLAQHVGRIEANLTRINALGERLVQSASLDPQEFNFEHDVGLGGPTHLNLSTLKSLEAALERRYVQLSALEQAIQDRIGKLELSFTGEGRVVAKGWISSFFGYRYDPFTGRKVWHSGVDIAGKEGAPIRALAGGIVSYSARKGGYGHLVEIKHANGLSTRYGHTKAILVKSGQVVCKGETIALLGSSGRSTGPHLHLEVHKDGKAVDPGLYFPDFRKGRKA